FSPYARARSRAQRPDQARAGAGGLSIAAAGEALCRARAPGAQAALGPALGARWSADVLGRPERDPGGSEAEPPSGPRRGPPAFLPRLSRIDPEGQLWSRPGRGVGPRRLRRREARGGKAGGGLPRRAPEGSLCAVSHSGRRLDDPPHGPPAK